MPMVPRWVPRLSSQVYESGPGSFVPISVQVPSSGNGFKGVYSTYHRVDFNQKSVEYRMFDTLGSLARASRISDRQINFSPMHSQSGKETMVHSRIRG